MKKFLKVLGAAALIAGLTPYQVEKNEETGERKVKALLWQVSRKQRRQGRHQHQIPVLWKGRGGGPAVQRRDYGRVRPPPGWRPEGRTGDSPAA